MRSTSQSAKPRNASHDCPSAFAGVSEDLEDHQYSWENGDFDVLTLTGGMAKVRLMIMPMSIFTNPMARPVRHFLKVALDQWPPVALSPLRSCSALCALMPAKNFSQHL